MWYLRLTLSTHFCTCTQHSNITLPSLAQTSLLVMAHHSACAVSFPLRAAYEPRGLPAHKGHCRAQSQCSSPVFLPSPAQVSRAPALNPILTKPTPLNSQFRQARTRVYGRTSPPFDQCCYHTEFLMPSPVSAFLVPKRHTRTHREYVWTPQEQEFHTCHNAEDLKADGDQALATRGHLCNTNA